MLIRSALFLLAFFLALPAQAQNWVPAYPGQFAPIEVAGPFRPRQPVRQMPPTWYEPIYTPKPEPKDVGDGIVDPAIIAATVKVSSNGSGGSGTVVGKEGRRAWVLTCKHVIPASGMSVLVEFPNGATTRGRSVAVDPQADLCLIEIAGDEETPFIPIAETMPREGDKVALVGFPVKIGGRPYWNPVRRVGIVSGQKYPGDLHLPTLTSKSGDSGAGVFLLEDNTLVGVLWGGRGERSMDSQAVDLNCIRRFIGRVCPPCLKRPSHPRPVVRPPKKDETPKGPDCPPPKNPPKMPPADDVSARIDSLEAKLEITIALLKEAQGKAGANGKDGRDGKDGTPGKDGRDGKDGASVDLDALAAWLKAHVKPGAPGPAGPPGAKGERGESGPPGPAGVAGKDADSKELQRLSVQITQLQQQIQALQVVAAGGGAGGESGKQYLILPKLTK